MRDDSKILLKKFVDVGNTLEHEKKHFNFNFYIVFL